MLFVTFDVSDMCTMIPRNGAVGNLKLDTILRLARLVLDSKYFAYREKYYKRSRGGAMGSLFTMVLTNICMLDWERPLIEHQQRHNELYERYLNNVSY